MTLRNFFGKTLESFDRLTSNRRNGSDQHSKRSRKRRNRRRLLSENLESRQMLAGDIGLFRHNVFDAEDVNNDGSVTPIDAIVVINAMNRNDRSGYVELFTDVNNDGNRSALDALRIVNRLNRGRDAGGPNDPRGGQNDGRVPVNSGEVRSFDGTGNNLVNPELGSTNEPLLRVADADYSDGISSPAGEDRPSAREISNVLSAIEGDGTPSDRQLSAFLYVWGQFIDHDIDLTPTQSGGESYNISVPEGDVFFDPLATGTEEIPLSRSQYDPETGTSAENPRQQISAITAYIDGSMVYGSDQATADSLRTFSGGKLILTEEGLLPTNDAGMVLAGDIRASENPSLTAIQTLFAREHNRLAEEIAAEHPGFSDEEIYQQARSVVIAEIQAITYNEFLPALLGPQALSRYRGYDATVDPTIATEFSTAAFRFGHSTLNDDIGFFDNEGRAVRDELELKDAFFNPSVLEETGIGAVLKYDASSVSQEIDLEIVDSLRNFLFGPPGAGGLDLAASNIQRGRDHGLSDYNATRVAYGLDAVDSFDDITSDEATQTALESLYGDVDNIDLWIGILAEDHVRNASIGELGMTVIADQFERLRDGDRFYYENVYSGQALRQLRGTTLQDVIERNTDVIGLQENVFFMRAEVTGRVLSPSGGESAGRGNGGASGNRAVGVEGVSVELLDKEGQVVETTVTDRRGNYRFTAFRETGDYQVRLSATGETLDLLVTNGSTRLRGLDFTLLS